MEILGHISFKKIFYVKVRRDSSWFDQLPADNWIAFAIANKEDLELIAGVAMKCLDKSVSCVCSAGSFSSGTESFFSDEIIFRNIQKEQEPGGLNEVEVAPMLTVHSNFSEGFWFASSIANPSIAGQNADIDKVICIDMTKAGVKKYLRELIARFNEGELPSDHEFEEPADDEEIK